MRWQNSQYYITQKRSSMVFLKIMYSISKKCKRR